MQTHITKGFFRPPYESSCKDFVKASLFRFNVKLLLLHAKGGEKVTPQAHPRVFIDVH